RTWCNRSPDRQPRPRPSDTRFSAQQGATPHRFGTCHATSPIPVPAALPVMVTGTLPNFAAQGYSQMAARSRGWDGLLPERVSPWHTGRAPPTEPGARDARPSNITAGIRRTSLDLDLLTSIQYFNIRRNMERSSAVAALAALAQDNRLDVFRLLV